ncbi:hypothetical protein VB264_05245 [Arcicella aquatica]|uniref:Uncharacterized protein n=1 Tax=Arcicella aquatica TaxID=217141 RepID=A0ABU5QJE8_9BACT|nr:hypothetical protein [Arcicella aquatica]MEA5257182.1 hypothetical protein [Arcicella aquatica]
MDTKLGLKKKLRMASVMRFAWKLFRKGMVSFSLSLKISWQLELGKLSYTAVSKHLKMMKR